MCQTPDIVSTLLILKKGWTWLNFIYWQSESSWGYINRSQHLQFIVYVSSWKPLTCSWFQSTSIWLTGFWNIKAQSSSLKIAKCPLLCSFLQLVLLGPMMKTWGDLIKLVHKITRTEYQQCCTTRKCLSNSQYQKPVLSISEKINLLVQYQF